MATSPHAGAESMMAVASAAAPLPPKPARLPRRLDLVALRAHLTAFPGFDHDGGDGATDDDDDDARAAVARAISAAVGGAALVERSLDLRAKLVRLELGEAAEADSGGEETAAPEVGFAAACAESARIERLLRGVEAAATASAHLPEGGEGEFSAEALDEARVDEDTEDSDDSEGVTPVYGGGDGDEAAKGSGGRKRKRLPTKSEVDDDGDDDDYEEVVLGEDEDEDELWRKWSAKRMAATTAAAKGTGRKKSSKAGKSQSDRMDLPPHWSKHYERLRAIFEETGRVSLDPMNVETADLRSWLHSQKKQIRRALERKDRTGADLQPRLREKMRRLEGLGINAREGGFEYVVHPIRFDEMLERYVQYKVEHGGAEVPKRSDDPRTAEICRWAVWQRKEYAKLKDGKPSKLTAEKMQQLVVAGFDFNFEFKTRGDYASWKDRMEQLRLFREEHGHLNVVTEYPVLGAFVKEKRIQFRRFMDGHKTSNKLKEQFQELERMGVVLETGNKRSPRGEVKTWDERFEDLVEFKSLNGHCVVPQHDGPLGGWVKRMRKEYGKIKKGGTSSVLTSERVVRLADLAFVWDATGWRRGGREGFG